MMELILGQIPEAVYFALFMILIKGFKEKRIIFIGLMVAQYLLLCNIFAYDLKFQFFFIFGSYIIMKLLYNKKVQITDVFLFALSSIVLMFSSLIGYIISYLTFKDLALASLLKLLFAINTLIIAKEIIIYYYKKYINNWNRKPNLKIKSLTLRNSSLIIFNVMLVILGLGITYVLYTK